MIRIYDVPDTLLSLLGQIVAREAQEEIDETESVPVLSDEPEDPEVTIETLQARILYLEAELEEHKRSVDGVLEALRPLGASAEPVVTSDATQIVSGPVVPDYEAAREGARDFLAKDSPWYLTLTGWKRK